MPTFEDPAVDATEAQQSLRGLAHTRSIDDPGQIYSVFASLSEAAASLGSRCDWMERVRAAQCCPRVASTGSQAAQAHAAESRVVEKPERKSATDTLSAWMMPMHWTQSKTTVFTY